jgi:hypothetical protein
MSCAYPVGLAAMQSISMMAAAVVPLKVEADETALALFKRTRSRPLRTGLAPLDRVSKLNTRLLVVV